MATFRLRHFSSPHVLRAIAPERLLAFLEPYGEFFSGRGYELPNAEAEIDYQCLISIFMTPNEVTPPGLLDALFLVDEVSTPEVMDPLLEAAIEKGFVPADGEDQTPADIAIQVWLFDSDIVERKHAEQFLWKRKSFEYFQSDRDTPPDFVLPSAAQRGQLEADLNDWFDKKKRGRNCRVFIYPRERDVAFLIRHGEPFKREETEENGEVSSVCYRPIKYDVAVYDRELGELRINAQLVGEKKLYCEKLGEHIFGDARCFPGTQKYCLDPLRDFGADSLACGDVDGIESITLTEIQIHWGGAYNARDIKRADDVFANLESRGQSLPEGGRITNAVFKVKFADSKTPRSVKIKGSNVAQYTRDSDAALIEQWLRLRGFMLREPTGTESPDEQVLVSA